jgi:hypothetical protein
LISLGSLFNRQDPPLLGLDISSSSVKLVELSRDKAGNLVLDRCAIEPLERGWITDGRQKKRHQDQKRGDGFARICCYHQENHLAGRPERV